MWLIIIGLVVLSGLFNPWTGVFSQRTIQKSEKEIKHKSFHLTKED